MVPLKYLSKFWKTLEMSVINRKINLDLYWSKSCVVVATDVPDQSTTFSVTDTKLYIPVVTLSTQGNAKLLEKLKSSFKRKISWSNYQSNKSIERQNNI